MTNRTGCGVIAGLVMLSAMTVWGEELPVYQGLEELTQRIAQLQDKPYEALIDEEGFYQPEIVIFHDLETGHEIWSLTREACTHLANIERRVPWSWNGRYMSFMGNRKFREVSGQLGAGGGAWAGHNYLANADGSGDRKFFANVDGQRRIMHNKFMTWHRGPEPILYFTVDDKLWKVTVGPGVDDNHAQVIYTFPNDTRKILQNISDDNKLCIQDWNGRSMEDRPNFYIIDLNRQPDDPDFCRYRTFNYGGMTGIEGHDPQNEYRVHGISLSRDGQRVSWSYGSMTQAGEYVSFSVPADDLDAVPTPRLREDAWGQYRSHPGTWSDGRSVYFSGPTDQIRAAGGDGRWGLWVRLPGQVPRFVGRPCAGGHATWAGMDPQWWFAHIGEAKQPWVDQSVTGRIVAGSADGDFQILCVPFDRRRGGGSGGYAAIPRPTQSPDATKCWFHSSMLMPSDEFTGSYVAVFRRPHPPQSLRVDEAEQDDTLVFRWTLHEISHEVRGVNLYMQAADTDGPWVQLNREPLAGERAVLPRPAGQHWRFMATSQEWSGLESQVTSPVVDGLGEASGDGLHHWDTTPPAPVKAFQAKRTRDGLIQLTWQPATDPDLRYYNIYASSTGQPPQPIQARLLVSPPRDQTQYLDWTAPKDAPLSYAIVAVDRQGNASPPQTATVADGKSTID